ncbi:MAG TPA: HEPN domain-containing protein [Candidatus Binatia bacterium]|nr:HEPN domain-containing protein [Candidatus Binatia bacterium]
MGFYAEPWLREAREKIRSFRDESQSANPGPDDFNKLAEAVEKAIKAALIENHGSLPLEHDHNQLVSICQTTGVWDVLPPALKGLVEEVESYQSTTKAALSQPSSAEASAEQLQRYFFVARRLIDYMEFHVIGNDSVLKRLKVA